MVKTTPVHSRAFMLMEPGIGTQKVTNTMNGWFVTYSSIVDLVDEWGFENGPDHSLFIIEFEETFFHCREPEDPFY